MVTNSVSRVIATNWRKQKYTRGVASVQLLGVWSHVIVSGLTHIKVTGISSDKNNTFQDCGWVP